MHDGPTLRERFQGCLLGLAIGDGLGARFEGQPAEHIQARYPTIGDLIARPPNNELWYTDDTQMMIGVAETLVEHRTILEEHLYAAFVANYVPTRGYGRGARRILEAVESGKDYRMVAETVFPGGSLGNGAAMRVAPVGLLFRDCAERLKSEAAASARPTHLHPLGIEGAQLIAHAVALASQMQPFDRETFFAQLVEASASEEYRQKLMAGRCATSIEAIAALGNGIEALDSAPTAVACFAFAPTSYAEAIGTAIFLGGDTDTIAAMTGAISGAFLGIQAIPAHLLQMLEDQHKGRTYITTLADKLFDAYQNGPIAT